MNSSSSSSSSSLAAIPKLVTFFLLFMFYVQSQPSYAFQSENPLVELSSRKDLVELAGYGEEKLSSVLVTGSVVCRTSCLDNNGEAKLRAWPIQDASVVVTCKTGGKRSKPSGAHGITDEYGDFIVDLPSKLHANPNLDKACIVRVLRLPKNSPCRQAFARKSKGITLSSIGNSIRMYTAGSITFKHRYNPLVQCIEGGGTGEKNPMAMFQ